MSRWSGLAADLVFDFVADIEDDARRAAGFLFAERVQSLEEENARLRTQLDELCSVRAPEVRWSEVALEDAIRLALRERSAADVGSMCARIIEANVDGVWVTAIVTPKEDPCG